MNLNIPVQEKPPKPTPESEKPVLKRLLQGGFLFREIEERERPSRLHDAAEFGKSLGQIRSISNRIATSEDIGRIVFQRKPAHVRTFKSDVVAFISLIRDINHLLRQVHPDELPFPVTIREKKSNIPGPTGDISANRMAHLRKSRDKSPFPSRILTERQSPCRKIIA